MIMAWIALLVAGVSEIVWAYCLKKSAGFTLLWPTVGFLGFLGVSMGLLAWSLRHIPLGVAYPVWTGVGAVGSVMVGIWLFSEPLGLMKAFFVGLILIGIVGLKMYP